VLLLPHGYEGQGPEHSSARIERFPQLCAEDNMTVGNCTTPAQDFHILRRQMCGGADGGPMQKPLVRFTPRSLRSAKAVSSLADLTSGGFPPASDDTTVDPAQVTRILFCSGKVCYVRPGPLPASLKARSHREEAEVTLRRQMLTDG